MHFHDKAQMIFIMEGEHCKLVLHVYACTVYEVIDHAEDYVTKIVYMIHFIHALYKQIPVGLKSYYYQPILKYVITCNWGKNQLWFILWQKSDHTF